MKADVVNLWEDLEYCYTVLQISFYLFKTNIKIVLKLYFNIHF